LYDKAVTFVQIADILARMNIRFRCSYPTISKSIMLAATSKSVGLLMNIKLTAVATTVITYLRNCGARDEESHRSMIIINRPSSHAASNKNYIYRRP